MKNKIGKLNEIIFMKNSSKRFGSLSLNAQRL